MASSSRTAGNSSLLKTTDTLQNGEITDPPVHASSSARYALSVERPSSPVFATAPDQVFCNNCIQNQKIYAQSLAEYYPTPNLATFQEYEQAEAEYRASLEERYPLICAECEPMVRERLRQTSYAAKTDNMRRVIERTRPEMRHLYEAGQWKIWIPFLGGLIWALSWAMQMAWDGLWILTFVPSHEAGQHVQETFRSIVRRFIPEEDALPDVTVLFQPLANYALLLGVVSAWWNPRLKEGMRRKGSRAIGLWDYYLQQSIFLAVRAALLYCVSFYDNIEHEQAAHTFMLFFSLVVSNLSPFPPLDESTKYHQAIVKSHYTIRLDYTPKAIWRESPKSLLSQPPRTPSSIDDTPTAHRRNTRSARPAPFPIESLAAKPLTPLFRPKTTEPHPNYDNPSFEYADRMDWAPTLPAPKPYNTPTTNPAPPPPFKPNLSPSNSIFSNLSPVKLADPTFFPSTDATETGLETIFDRAFTISRPPAEVREQQQLRKHALAEERQRAPVHAAIRSRVVLLVLLCLACGMLFHSFPPAVLKTLPLSPVMEILDIYQRQMITFAISAIVTLRAMTEAGRSGRRVLVFIAGLEAVATAVFGGSIFGFGAGVGGGGGGEWDFVDEELKAVTGQLALAIVGVGELMLLARDCVRVRL